MRNWILYNLAIGLAVYWASNLLLWFPWSINPTFGMVLMLTIGTAIWALATHQCLVTFPERSLIKAALYNGCILLSIAVVMDYIFFVLIRDAMNDLYHPTTFYGYGFVASLPFLFILFRKEKIQKAKKAISKSDWVFALTTGIVCFGVLTFIIIFDIHI